MREGWWEIGTAYRGAVVRQDRIEAPTTWLASGNAGYPGEYSDRGAAMARVQAEVERRIEVPLHDLGRRRPDTAVSEAPAIGRMGTRRGVMIECRKSSRGWSIFR